MSAITFDSVKRYFHLPSKQAAEKLGIGTSSLKKLCRSHGLRRWPHRKIKSLQHKLSVLPTFVQPSSFQFSQSTAETLQLWSNSSPTVSSTSSISTQDNLPASLTRVSKQDRSMLRVTCPTQRLERSSPVGMSMSSPSSSSSDSGTSPMSSIMFLDHTERDTPVTASRWKYQTQVLSATPLPHQIESTTTAAAAASFPYDYVPLWDRLNTDCSSHSRLPFWVAQPEALHLKLPTLPSTPSMPAPQYPPSSAQYTLWLPSHGSASSVPPSTPTPKFTDSSPALVAEATTSTFLASHTARAPHCSSMKAPLA